jgi:hypothetical protein
MKIIKISIAVIVVAIITFFAIRSCETTGKVGAIQQSGNPFVDKIQQEIAKLKIKPDNQFCKEFYAEVVYHIDEYHRDNRLGKSTLENNQWKENLAKQLYAAYSDKFIKQSYYLLNHSEWAINDLGFIRNECNALQSSTLLERNSPTDKKFNEIKAIFNKYDEITGFISSCKNFSFSQTSLDFPFPIPDVTNKISTANNFINNNLGNYYVNNCARLHNELKEVPHILFRIHVRYLDNLIVFWSNWFTKYNTQKAYVSGTYNPLLNKIQELDNGIYNVSEFNNEYSRLKDKWQLDGTNAYNHFTSK